MLVAGCHDATPPTIAELVQANPALLALRVPKIQKTEKNKAPVAEAFSKNPIMGQPSQRDLLDHIKMLAATHRLSPAQARYLADNRQQPVTLWKAVGNLSQNFLTDSNNEISATASQIVLDTFRVAKFARFTSLWKRTIPEALDTGLVIDLNNAIKALTGDEARHFSQADADNLQQATANVLFEITNYLNRQMQGVMETHFHSHRPIDAEPLALGFEALQGYVFDLNPDDLSEELWEAIKIALHTLTELATPGMTANHLAGFSPMMEEVREEVEIVRGECEKRDIDPEDRDAIDTLLETLETWVITCYDEFEGYAETVNTADEEVQRWSLDVGTANINTLNEAIKALPEAANELEQKLGDWCREAYESLSQIDTPWHELECWASHSGNDILCDYTPRALDQGTVILLETDTAAHEEAEQIHRGYMENGETMEIAFDWDTDPESIVKLARTMKRGLKLLDDLQKITG